MFATIFPDSKIAASFTCGKDKTRYLVNHGICPWIKELLEAEVESASLVVIGFDESLNKMTQTCQMDLNVRYWDPVENLVKVRYWDSKFLGHTANTDLLASFNESTLKISSSKVIQVSMDGPSVNHLFYQNLVKHRSDVDIKEKMVSIGSCGLHIVHGSFKHAFEKTSWKMKGLLKGSFVILHDTPARRADYITITKSELFPLFFCATRWVEDKEPADRLYEIWPNMVKIVDFWLGLPKNKQPSGKSWNFVLDATKDVLTRAKLGFFSYVASILEPFLTKFQTAKPMVPYLYEDMSDVYRSILQIVFLEDTTNVEGCKLAKINTGDKKILKKEQDYTVGFVAQRNVKKLMKKDAVTRKELDDFYENVLVCVQALILKLNERCSLTSTVVRSSIVFNPLVIRRKTVTYLKKHLGFLVEHLVSLKLVKEASGDKVLLQYTSLYNDVTGATFDDSEFPETRLDDFFYRKLLVHKKYPDLSEVLSIILTLSHGNSDVERGFSLNKGVQKVHVSEESIVSKRHVKDYMLSHDLQPHTIKISNELRKSCRQARSRYHHFLEEQKKQKEKATQETAKELLSMEIEQLESKIAVLQRSTDELNKKFEEKFMEASNLDDSNDVVVAVNEASAFKVQANKQSKDITKLEEALKVLMEKMKTL